MTELNTPNRQVLRFSSEELYLTACELIKTITTNYELHGYELAIVVYN